MMEIKIRGLREIQRALAELQPGLEKKVLEEGLVAGAQLVRDDAKARAPILAEETPRRQPGTLRRAIYAGRVSPQSSYAASVWVRVKPLTKQQIAAFKKRRAKKGQRWSGAFNPNDPFYWRFVEFGTSKMAARPFMRPAFEAKKLPAVQRSIDVFRQRMQQTVEALGRRYSYHG